MSIKKIYGKKNVDRHFNSLQKIEKKAVLKEKIILKYNDINKFIDYEKRNIFKKYFIKVLYSVLFLLFLHFFQNLLLSIEYKPYVQMINIIKNYISFDIDFYFNYLIACLGVCGFLIALFFSNLSGVFALKYSNLNSRLSYSILNEYTNKNYFESIVNYLIIIIVELFCFIIDININFLTMILTIAMTIRIVIIFIFLSKRIFDFNNINFITFDTCQTIIYYFDKLKIAVKHLKKDSIIISYKNKIKTKILILEELYEAFINEKDKKGLCEFNIYIIDLLSHYCGEKNTIPHNDLWYDEKIKPKNWFEADFFEVKTGILTGTTLYPSFEKNTNFFEEELTDIFLKSINYLTEMCYKTELNNILNYYQESFKKLKNNGDYNFWIDINNRIINIISNNVALFQSEDSETMYIMDIISLFYIDYVLDFTNYISSIYSQIELSTTNVDSFVKSLGLNNCIISSGRTIELIKKLNFEYGKEKKYITTVNYIKEYIYWELDKYIVEYIEKFPKVFEDMLALSKKLSKHNNKISSCIILSRMIELSKKVDDSLSKLSTIVNNINLINNNFEYKSVNINNVKDKCNKIFISALMLYADVSAQLSLEEYDYRDKKIDFYGECFYNLAQMVFESIIKENISNFEKLYKKFFMISVLCDEIVHKIVNSNYNIDYVLSKYKIPLLHLMDLSGYAIYYTHLTGNKKCEEVVSNSFEEFINVLENKNEFLKKLVTIASIDKSIFSIDVLKTDFKMSFQRFIKESNYLKYKSAGPFFQQVIDSKDELISKFTFYDDEFYYDFYEIFVHYYVNPKLDKSDRLKIKFIK